MLMQSAFSRLMAHRVEHQRNCRDRSLAGRKPGAANLAQGHLVFPFASRGIFESWTPDFPWGMIGACAVRAVYSGQPGLRVAGVVRLALVQSPRIRQPRYHLGIF